MPPRTDRKRELMAKKLRANVVLMRKRYARDHTKEELEAMGFDKDAPFLNIDGHPDTEDEVEDEDSEEEEEGSEESEEEEEEPPKRKKKRSRRDDEESDEEEPDEERSIGRKRKKKVMKTQRMKKSTDEAPKMPRVSAKVAPKRKKSKMRHLRVRDEMKLSADDNRKMRANFGKTTTRWTDNDMMRRSTFTLKVVRGEKLMKLCDAVIDGLTDKVTEKVAKRIMQAAYNLHGLSKDSRVFKNANPCLPTPMEEGYLNSRIAFEGSIREYVVPDDIDEEDYARACCYIAASTLRLFTKSTDNFMKALSHIKAKYYRFYKDEFPLKGFAVDKKCIEGLKEIYTNKHVFKNALAPFLYSFSSLQDPKGMCKLLYEQHLALTGMHAVNLFVKVCLFAHCLAEELSSGLWHRATRDALREIKDILVNHYLSEDTNQQKQTWMYARLMDDTRFTPIQTSYCKNLVCALAFMAGQMGIAGNQNVMNIVHIQKMTAAARAIPIRWAERLIQNLNESDKAADGNELAMESDDGYDDEDEENDEDDEEE